MKKNDDIASKSVWAGLCSKSQSGCFCDTVGPGVPSFCVIYCPHGAPILLGSLG